MLGKFIMTVLLKVVLNVIIISLKIRVVSSGAQGNQANQLADSAKAAGWILTNGYPIIDTVIRLATAIRPGGC